MARPRRLAHDKRLLVNDAQLVRIAMLETVMDLADTLRPGWTEENEVPPECREEFLEGIRYALAVLVERMEANNVSAETQLQLGLPVTDRSDR